MFPSAFIFSTGGGGASREFILLPSEVIFIVCTVNSSPMSKSSSWVTLLASGDRDCGSGVDQLQSTPQKASYEKNSCETPSFLLVMGSIEQSCLHRIRLFVPGRKRRKQWCICWRSQSSSKSQSTTSFYSFLTKVDFDLCWLEANLVCFTQIWKDNVLFHLLLGWWIDIFGRYFLWHSLINNYKGCTKFCLIENKTLRSKECKNSTCLIELFKRICLQVWVANCNALWRILRGWWQSLNKTIWCEKIMKTFICVWNAVSF